MVVGMFPALRRRTILELVHDNGAASLRDLADAVGTSEVTVRRDLRALEAEGALDRHRGGAVVPGVLTHEATHSQKARVSGDEKQAIARAAIRLVEAGDAIAVGAGTTTHAFARCLARQRDLTVVTNSLLVANALTRPGGPEVIVTGGSVRASILALVGSTAEQTVSRLRVRRAFISGNGLTANRGLSTPNVQVAALDRAMVAAAEEVVVLADHTKIGVDTMVQTVEPGQISHLVCDEAADEAEVQALRALGVVVHLAPRQVDAAPTKRRKASTSTARSTTRGDRAPSEGVPAEAPAKLRTEGGSREAGSSIGDDVGAVSAPSQV